ncbi:MAG: hypothetical protein R3257_05195 [bacterium]|nr:hypothetical protein [bacterium]
MGKFISLFLAVSFLVFGLVITEAQSQLKSCPVKPNLTTTIENCKGNNPPRDAVLDFEEDCDVLAADLGCSVGVVHPDQCSEAACQVGCDGYCEVWGCYLHGCPN